MSANATLATRLRTGLMAVAAFVRGNTDRVHQVQAAIDAVEEAISRIAELEAENARLTAEVDTWHGAALHQANEATIAEREVARLTAEQTTYEDTDDDADMAIKAMAALRTPADGYREGAEAMREACADIAKATINRGDNPKLEKLLGGEGSVYRMIIAGIAEDAIHALPIPSPPAEEKT